MRSARKKYLYAAFRGYITRRSTPHLGQMPALKSPRSSASWTKFREPCEEMQITSGGGCFLDRSSIMSRIEQSQETSSSPTTYLFSNQQRTPINANTVFL